LTVAGSVAAVATPVSTSKRVKEARLACETETSIGWREPLASMRISRPSGAV